jgi:hypothetical protein
MLPRRSLPFVLFATLIPLGAIPSPASASFDDEEDEAAPSAAIVYVDDRGKSCPLVRFDPTAKGDARQREMASLPGPCRGARTAFGPSRHAVVWFDAETIDRKPRLPGMRAARYDEEPARKGKARLYEIAGRKVRALPELPENFGAVRDVGFSEATICALTVEDPAAQTTREDGGQLYVKYDEQFIPLSEGAGRPTLAHALCLDGGAWTRR